MKKILRVCILSVPKTIFRSQRIDLRRYITTRLTHCSTSQHINVARRILRVVQCYYRLTIGKILDSGFFARFRNVICRPQWKSELSSGVTLCVRKKDLNTKLSSPHNIDHNVVQCIQQETLQYPPSVIILCHSVQWCVQDFFFWAD